MDYSLPKGKAEDIQQKLEEIGELSLAIIKDQEKYSKDELWKNINKTQNLNVYDKVILKYPPEIKKLEIINNIDIIRKTFIRFAAPLLIFMLII